VRNASIVASSRVTGKRRVTSWTAMVHLLGLADDEDD
jgi:hypothetical protein